MLKVGSLGKRFGSNWLFRGIEFELKQGDRLAVTGANGSGKSTLLRILAGLERPSLGTVEVGGSLSFAAIDQAVYPSLTVREHLLLAADLRGCEARADELLARISLEFAADRQASHLSTGMRGRLKLALAIQNDPDIMLLDEPGAGLDEKGRELVREIADEQAERGVLIVATNEAMERRLATLELAIA